MTETPGNTFSLSRLSKAALWLLVWLGMVALGYWLVASLVGLPAPRLIASTVGARGPVVLEFLTPVDQASLLARAEVLPAVAGTWQVEGNRAVFRPLTPFDGSERYQIRLAAGVTDAAGRRRLREAVEWDLTVRRPEVVFLGEASVQPEVWKVTADGSHPVRLTKTGGTVYDFAVSPQGDQIAYSASSPAGGFDLWIVDRDGQNA
ncbi:MAG TPA: Ig-like domain-containing protein, partial [Anaerolineaceae bacterium]|nr:Ig-like domain-containing protein [Anaerolineaceae bacterium]